MHALPGSALVLLLLAFSLPSVTFASTVITALGSSGNTLSSPFSHSTPHGEVTGHYTFTMANNSHVLDDHPDFTSVTTTGDIIFTSSPTSQISVGDFIFGTPAGAWNSTLSDDHARRLLAADTDAADTGVTLSRRVTAVASDPSSGNLVVSTAPAHPQTAVVSSSIKATVDTSKSHAALIPHRNLREDRQLEKYCDEACTIKEYYRTDDVALCSSCFEVGERHAHEQTRKWQHGFDLNYSLKTNNDATY